MKFLKSFSQFNSLGPATAKSTSLPRRLRASARSQRRRLNRRNLVERLENRMVLDGTYFALSGGSFTQDWTNTSLISVDDDWSVVPSIIGYRGDDLTTVTGADPQTLIADLSGPIDVNANRTDPDVFNSGGVVEFEIANPVVALQGSGTGDAPNLQFHLNAVGRQDIRVQYNLRDIDAGAVDAIQQVALQFRTGSIGEWTNLPGGYVADASTGPSLATLVTAIDVTLPAIANNQSQVQVRVITTNAVGTDEFIGIDDIVISSVPATVIAPTVAITPVTPDPRNVPVTSIQIVFSEPVVNFNVADLALTRDGGANLFNGSETLTSGDNTTFTLGNLSGLTAIDGAYTLTLSVSDIQDIDSNALVSGAIETWSLDGTVPTVTTLKPVDNATAVFAEDNLVVTFSENVIKGTGNITVHRLSDNSVVSTIDVTSAEVIVTGNIVNINPAANLPTSSGLYVNIPATAFRDAASNFYAGIADATTWNFTTLGITSVLAEQDFNLLTGNTQTSDNLPSGSQLTNTGSFNTGGPQLDFATFWFDSRNTGGNGPATLTQEDGSDFIGVNTFNGNFSPNISAGGLAVGNAERNFELNDADGELRLVFETFDVAGFTNRFLTFNYWINDTVHDVGDFFRASISDGTNTNTFIDFDPAALDANASPDNNTANWRTATLNLDTLVTGMGFGTNLTLTLAASNDADLGNDNVFVDNLLVRGESVIVAPEIDVLGNSTSIASGDMTPSTLDATSFGLVAQGAAPVTATFTIANNGNAPLALSGSPNLVAISGSSNFTITTQPATASVAATASTTFVVTYTPTTAGLQTATISIANNDSDENPYTFDVSGTAVELPNVWINEISYDNLGADVGEFVEVAGTAGFDLSTLSLVLYNGFDGTSYNTTVLAGTIDNEGGTGFGAVSFLIPGIQNGAPDGIALVLGGTTVLSFISYEGVFAATNGPASGMTSVDIGVTQLGNATAPVGSSLQRNNSVPGTPGAWFGPADDSPGDLNVFVSPGVTITQSGGTTVVAEGGATDTYTIVLDSAPISDVTVTVTPDGQLDLGAGAATAVSLVFTTANWFTPQTVTVTAFDDAVTEGPHSGSITHAIATGSAIVYLGLPIAGVTASITDNDGGDAIPPTVTGVFLVNSAWLPGGQDPFDGGGAGAGNGIGLAVTAGLQIPNGNLNRIVVQFSEPVVGFSTANFRLLGVNTADYAGVLTVSYDAVTNRGIINLSTPLNRDRLRVGVSQNVTDAAGNQLDGDLVGGAGGNFDLLFSVLVGNGNLDASGVNGGDLGVFAAAFNQSFPSGTYNINADWNSDGSVNGADLANFAANFNLALPGGTPGPLNFGGGTVPGAVYSPAVDAFFKNLGDKDDLDLLAGGELF